MDRWEATLLYKADLLLGEGPHWHPAWRKYLYTDIEGMKVGCIDPVTKIPDEKNTGKRTSTVVPASNGNLIVALQGALSELNFLTGEFKEMITVEADKPNNRCNDGKCDAAGRLWIGTMDVEAKGNNGALYCYDGKKIEKKLEGLKVSNGICWSQDNKTMYFIDSFDYNLKAFDFDLAEGNLSNERIIVTVDEPGCAMDGMTIDENGMLWVAIWGGNCVNRYNPATGELIGKVQVDAPQVTSCCFGGENMQQLFITTARVGLTDGQLQQYPNSGSLFVVNTGLKGEKINYFNSK